MGLDRPVQAVVRPSTIDEVRNCVVIASEAGVPLYPVSTGRNWGYGSRLPPLDAVVLDLGRLARIEVRADESDLGMVTVEPGVTQGQLSRHLDDHGLPFMVPTTGAGPDCSLLGNALERGFGITPATDHFAAVVAVTVVLPDGSLYESPLCALSAPDQRVPAFKWGIGPYLDGLFGQSNLGVVVRMTLQLVRRPERVEAFVFNLKRDADLEAAVDAVRGLQQSLPGLVGGINLLNRRRGLSMFAPYPDDEGRLIPDPRIEAMGREHGVAPWLGIGGLYADSAVVAGARRAIRRRLRPVSRMVTFFSHDRVRLLRRVAAWVPGRKVAVQRERLGSFEQALDIMVGRPRRVALPLAYWRPGFRPPESAETLDPDRDRCGLMWYAPLLPLDGAAARRATDFVERTCRKHGFNPLITLTALSGSVADATVPLLFDPDTEAEAARACYLELVDEGRKLGLQPYRLNVAAMDRVTGQEGPTWDLARRIKHAVDPKGIIAPGRYIAADSDPDPDPDPSPGPSHGPSPGPSHGPSHGDGGA
ncbi:FAD-binding oxidoreductase [Caenispirillum salinarum]|uniref:FAD-binding oxidoreductase n=1 Tax=Caenispirillum salinarum TaxID=859058 RepID=UPI00384C8D20